MGSSGDEDVTCVRPSVVSQCDDACERGACECRCGSHKRYEWVDDGVVVGWCACVNVYVWVLVV